MPDLRLVREGRVAAGPRLDRPRRPRGLPAARHPPGRPRPRLAEPHPRRRPRLRRLAHRGPLRPGRAGVARYGIRVTRKRLFTGAILRAVANRTTWRVLPSEAVQECGERDGEAGAGPGCGRRHTCRPPSRSSPSSSPASSPNGRAASWPTSPNAPRCGCRPRFWPPACSGRSAPTPSGAARLIGPATDLSATGHAEALVAATGLADHAAGLRLALVGPGPPAETAPIADPVLVPMVLPGADGMLAAAPAGGWTARPAAIWPIRLLTLLAGGLIVGPMLRTRRLIGERQRQHQRAARPRGELERLSRRLGLALDASQGRGLGLQTSTPTCWSGTSGWTSSTATRRPAAATAYADWRDRLHPEDLDRAEAEFREAVEVTGRYVSDYRLLLPGGAVRHIRAIGKRLPRGRRQRARSSASTGTSPPTCCGTRSSSPSGWRPRRRRWRSRSSSPP